MKPHASLFYNVTKGFGETKFLSMNKLIITSVVILVCFTMNSQRIGEKAEIIHYLVEQNFNQRKTRDVLKYGELQYKFDVIYDKDNIKEIIVDELNAVFYDLEAKSDIRIRYLMNEGLLESVITNFYDLTVEGIRQKFNRRYQKRRLDETLYFDRDYKSYRYIHWEEEIPTITYTLYRSDGFDVAFNELVLQKQKAFNEN